jgi:GT2 family glycosyltransferase
MPRTQSSQELMVSVIIVSWNARACLEQCLASLTQETCRYPMEIIVVDNASSDGSAECVENQFPHVRLVRNDSNLGFARANNVGIAQSKGRYLCLVNSDVKVLKDCITRLVDYCEEHLQVGMVGPRVLGGDGKLQRSCRGFPNLWNMFCRALALDTFFPRVKAFCGYALSHWPHDTLTEVDILSGCFWLARRDAAEGVGGLDESFFMYGEDMDWCRRFRSAGWELVFVPGAEAIHYGGASSANAPVRFAVELQRADFQYWRKHYSSLKVASYFLLACLYNVFRIAGFLLAVLASKKQRSLRWQKVQMSLACLEWMFLGRKPAGMKCSDGDHRRLEKGVMAVEKVAG